MERERKKERKKSGEVEKRETGSEHSASDRINWVRWSNFCGSAG